MTVPYVYLVVSVVVTAAAVWAVCRSAVRAERRCRQAAEHLLVSAMVAAESAAHHASRASMFARFAPGGAGGEPTVVLSPDGRRHRYDWPVWSQAGGGGGSWPGRVDDRDRSPWDGAFDALYPTGRRRVGVAPGRRRPAGHRWDRDTLGELRRDLQRSTADLLPGVVWDGDREC